MPPQHGWRCNTMALQSAPQQHAEKHIIYKTHLQVQAEVGWALANNAPCCERTLLSLCWALTLILCLQHFVVTPGNPPGLIHVRDGTHATMLLPRHRSSTQLSAAPPLLPCFTAHESDVLPPPDLRFPQVPTLCLLPVTCLHV